MTEQPEKADIVDRHQMSVELRAEIARLRAAVRDQAGVELSEENDRLIDEIARLRAQRDQLRAALRLASEYVACGASILKQIDAAIAAGEDCR